MQTIDKYFKIVKSDNPIKTNLFDINKKLVIVFTDGATINNGKKNAIGGIGVYNQTDNIENSEKIIYRTFNKPVTNNLCELYAIKYAIDKYANTNETLRIVTDSEYCVNVFTKWAINWKKNNWIKRDKKPILNLELIKYIYNKTLMSQVLFQHCNSHRPEPQNKNDREYMIWKGNYIADKLASEVIKT